MYLYQLICLVLYTHTYYIHSHNHTALNMSVFLLIGKTSALTMNVAGVVKDWLLIGLSALLFQYVVWGVREGCGV